MSPERHTQQIPLRRKRADAMMGELAQLDKIAAQLMAVQRHWNDPDRDFHLTAALRNSRRVWHAIQTELAESQLPFPLDIQHNLLILSVYADSKIDACESDPDADTLSRLLALTHTLAGSLKEWRVAA